MNPASVVEQLNLVKDGCLCLLTGRKVTVVGNLIFQVREEALCHRVVIATLASTHVRADSPLRIIARYELVLYEAYSSGRRKNGCARALPLQSMPPDQCR